MVVHHRLAARRRRRRDLGVQVTFFRSRPRIGDDNPSAFAPRQLLFAHAAIADPALGRLVHDQRAARAGFGLADAAEGTTDVRIDDWSLALDGNVYRTRIAAREFALDLAFAANQPILLQGEGGVSRKGPRPDQASYYYSRPHLAVQRYASSAAARATASPARLARSRVVDRVPRRGGAGWDWIGINLADGGALMAFRIRAGRRRLLGGRRAAERGRPRARLRTAGDRASRRAALALAAERHGLSGRDAVRAGAVELVLEPLMDDQELDSAREHRHRLLGRRGLARVGERIAGRGYLELTGYGKPVRF